LILAGGSEGSARVYETRAIGAAANQQSTHAKHVLTGHRGKVQACAFAPDGRHAVTGSHDRSMIVWDVNSGGALRTIICMSACNDVEVSPDGNVVYSAHQDGKIRLWDLRSGSAMQEVAGPVGAATCVALSPDLTSIATVGRGDSTIRILDARTLKVTNSLIDSKFQTACNWHAACFSPCGNYIASGSASGNVIVWNSASGRVERCLEGHAAPVYSVAWGSDPGGLVSGDKDKCIIAWAPRDC
jgi:WD40 repeat protein